MISGKERELNNSSEPWLNYSDDGTKDHFKLNRKKYPMHYNITSTVFWIGEGATTENGFIDNFDSVWDDCWLEHYGGVDDPYDTMILMKMVKRRMIRCIGILLKTNRYVRIDGL